MVHRIARKHQHPDVNKLNLGAIVILDDAEWYSPTAAHAFKPLADIFVCRECHKAGVLDKAGLAWLSGLASNRMMIRKKGTYPWKLVVGVVFESIVKTLDIVWDAGADLIRQDII